MDGKTGKKSWVRKIVLAVVIAEVSYVLLFNLALQLPLTQTLINKIKPDKFHVTWENAWTFYPFRIHVRGASANGQSRSQQWEADVGSASASIDVLPLIFKRVWIDDVVAAEINYRQRPRLKPDRDYSEVMEFFPPITGREVTGVSTKERKKKRPWKVEIEDIRVDSNFAYWINQYKGKAKGVLEADLDIVTKGGPFLMSVPTVELELEPHYINGTQELFRHGVISGELGFAPFVPKENKGVKVLQYALIDADINIDVNSLVFINLFTRGFNGMKIDGAGLVDGRVHMAEGRVLDGTDLSIDATNLQVDLLSHNIEGDGAIRIEMSPETDDLLDMKVVFNDMVVTNETDDNPLLTGQDLGLNARAGGDLFPGEGDVDNDKNISLDLKDLSVPDLALFQRYLPEKWPLRLYGGKGNLHGKASLSTDAANVDLQVTSEAADMGISAYRFDTNLDVAVKISNPSLRASPTFVSGSYFKLLGARLKRDKEDETEPWHASFVIRNGDFSVFESSDKEDKEKTVDLFKMLGQTDVKQLLGDSNGSFEIESSVSSLAWVGVLMNENYHSRTSGSGTITGLVNIDKGLPASGTDIEVESDSLGLSILDYEASGDGKIVFQVVEAGDKPDWLLKVDLADGNLKRQGASKAEFQDVNLSLNALIEDMSFEKKKRQFALEFKIPTAHVDDMSVFNHYFPPDSPVQLTRGTADLAVDVMLKHDDADGYLRLKAKALEARIDDQSVTADFDADITLVGGVPGEMLFDISGSELSLDNVKVIGENDSFNKQNWATVLTLTQAETTWVDPLLLKAEANLSMTDSRPIVAMFGNQDDRPNWMKNMLIVEDIDGTLEMDVADNKILIPYAFMDSDNIDFGAKGVIDETLRNGVVYARYKKLDAVVRLSDGKKNIDLIEAKSKFDEYQPSAKP